MVPINTGLYFAKSNKNRHRFDLIVRVEGESPMYYIPYIFDMGSGFNEPRVIRNVRPYFIEEWGPRIIETDDTIILGGC